MVNVSDLSPGMRVKIVDSWSVKSSPNFDGYMNCYLGQTVTVSKITEDNKWFHIEEDNRNTAPSHGAFGKWFFDGYMVEEIVDGNDEPLQAKPIAKLFS